MAKTINGKWMETYAEENDLSDFSSMDTLVINTDFNLDEISECQLISEKSNFLSRLENTKEIISKYSKSMKKGGILFVYGYPQYLSEIAYWLNSVKIDNSKFVFKYWIALEFKGKDQQNHLPNSHMGLLMYLKVDALKKATPFNLNTKEVRIPHQTCAACGQNIKDWGGKKHLLNPFGTALSDVWKDNVLNLEIYTKIPEICLQRIYDLRVKEDKSKMVVVYEKNTPSPSVNTANKNTTQYTKTKSELELDQVITADSLKLMDEIHDKYPEGIFDMVFADPPYNLSKSYNKYRDEQSIAEYIEWCDEWLNKMCNVLRPGGSLFVLNIPMWAIYHAHTLNKRMVLRNWIVWDALSTPSGKLLPAHYSLLYYTKPGGIPTTNYNSIKEIDSRDYCLRASCIKNRHKNHLDKKEDVTDIWHDIFRIRHKKDRDEHPCQLPIKLLSRIITYSTNEGDTIYDPFGGAGTTAISAKICNRHYIISDIDEKYKKIAENNLANIFEKMSGEKILLREKHHITKNVNYPKNKIENRYYQKSKELGYTPSIEELSDIDIALAKIISENYSDFKYLKKITNRRLENMRIIDSKSMNL